MREDAEQFLADLANVVTEPSLELLVGGLECQLGPRPDQIHHRLRLGQIHLPIEEGALGEFAWFGEACACGEDGFQDLLCDQDSARGRRSRQGPAR